MFPVLVALGDCSDTQVGGRPSLSLNRLSRKRRTHFRQRAAPSGRRAVQEVGAETHTFQTAPRAPGVVRSSRIYLFGLTLNLRAPVFLSLVPRDNIACLVNSGLASKLGAQHVSSTCAPEPTSSTRPTALRVPALCAEISSSFPLRQGARCSVYVFARSWMYAAGQPHMRLGCTTPCLNRPTCVRELHVEQDSE